MRSSFSLVVLLLTSSLSWAQLPPGETFEFHNPDELDQYFEKAGFTLEKWREGDRTVPRFYLYHVPERWRLDYVPKWTTQRKLRWFFFVYSPLVLKWNEAVMAERSKLEALMAAPEAERAAGTEGERWLTELAQRYQVKGAPTETATMKTLLDRVDVVPTSLALAQGAVESAWGTSRFADEGNALFGQWTFGEDGITPSEQRASKGKYKVKSFPRPGLSVAAYIHNLNTHPTYEALRKLRAQQRARGLVPSGDALAAGLTKYSERGQAYVDELRSIIRRYSLAETDAAHLREGPDVWLVPVGPGSR